MKRKLCALCMLLLLAFSATVFAACNDDPPVQPGEELPGTETPGEDPGTDPPADDPADDPTDDPVTYTVIFDTQGGTALPNVTVEKGAPVGEVALPSKQCAEFVCFSLDADGTEKWDIAADPVLSDMTLYVIWADSHTWESWEEEVSPTCTETGESVRRCEVCGKEEHRTDDALGHDFEHGSWVCADDGHEKKCSRCDEVTAKAEHVFDGDGICECGYERVTLEDMFEFVSVGDGEWEIGAYIGSATEVTVPAEYNGRAVISIGKNAFHNNDTVTSIYVPEGVTSIGCSAFEGCSNLRELSLPDSLTFVDSDAFAGFVSFRFNYNEYAGARYIGNENNPYLIFTGVADTSLSELTLHDDTRIIYDGALVPSEIKNLKRIVLSDALIYITDHTFDVLKNMYSFEYNEYGSADYIGSKTNPYMVLFKSGSDTKVIHPDTVFIMNGALGGCEMTSLTIPSSVKSIGNSAFLNCTLLRSLVIPDGVAAIGRDTMKFCSSLVSVTLPDSIESIGKFAFYFCDSLQSITFKGTVEEWNAIEKDAQWINKSVNVLCSNGAVSVNV